MSSSQASSHSSFSGLVGSGDQVRLTFYTFSSGSRLWEDKMLAGYTALPSCLTFDELCVIRGHHQLSDKVVQHCMYNVLTHSLFQDCSVQCLSRVLAVKQYVKNLCSVEEVGITCDPHTNVFSVMKTTLPSVLVSINQDQIVCRSTKCILIPFVEPSRY